MTRWLEAAKRARTSGTELTEPTQPRPIGEETWRDPSGNEVLSVKSVLSEGVRAETPEPRVTSVAHPLAPKNETSPHGFTPEGRPKTWAGRIVSLEDWRALREW